jgi:hypothetical protein
VPRLTATTLESEEQCYECYPRAAAYVAYLRDRVIWVGLGCGNGVVKCIGIHIESSDSTTNLSHSTPNPTPKTRPYDRVQVAFDVDATKHLLSAAAALGAPLDCVVWNHPYPAVRSEADAMECRERARIVGGPYP